MAERLRTRARERGSAVAILGPAPAYIAKRADRWRWNLVLRGDDPAGLLDGGLEPPWSVDVDPEIAALRTPGRRSRRPSGRDQPPRWRVCPIRATIASRPGRNGGPFP